MMNYKSFLILLIAAFSNLAIAQSKKDVKKYFIKSVTESVTEKVNGSETIRMKSYKKYDGNGNIIEEADYHKDGTFKSKTIIKFNTKNDATEELITDSNKKVIQHFTHSYNGDNDKATEIEWDDKGKLISKSTYTYNKNGLKTEKKTFNSNNELIAVKKYTYEF